MQRVSVDPKEVELMRSFGLLLPGVHVEAVDVESYAYGIAYNSRRNIGRDTFESQQAIQDRCKKFARAAGFDLLVSTNSSGSKSAYHNSKYTYKRLNGQQRLQENPAPGTENDECPFFINVAGTTKNGVSTWKPTKACLVHDHYKNTGYTHTNLAESGLGSSKRLRDRSRSMQDIAMLVESELLPAFSGDIVAMTGHKINSFLTQHV